MKIIHISMFPPPIGGKSSFLKRLKEYTDDGFLTKQYYYVDVSGIDIERKKQEGIVCIRKIEIIPYLLQQENSYVVFHSNSSFHLLINLIFIHKHKFIYFTHGESIIKDKNYKGWRNKILQNAHSIICPTAELTNMVRKMLPNKERIFNIPFIIYSKNVTPLCDAEINKLRNRVDFLFSSYAYTLKKFKGNDLYGLDLVIESMYHLRQKGYNVGVVILISDDSNHNMMDQYINSINKYELADYILIKNEALGDGAELYTATDAYLRPTNTDGDSFSIWESLHSGIPVITSDATQRPTQCILFNNRNVMDLVDKEEYLINHYTEIRQNIINANIKGNEKELINFFEHL